MLSLHIGKTSNPSHPKQSLILSTMGGNESFLATTLTGEDGLGDDGMNPKPIKKLLLGAESYVTITWKGFFKESQVVLSSIV